MPGSLGIDNGSYWNGDRQHSQSFSKVPFIRKCSSLSRCCTTAHHSSSQFYCLRHDRPETDVSVHMMQYQIGSSLFRAIKIVAAECSRAGKDLIICYHVELLHQRGKQNLVGRHWGTLLGVYRSERGIEPIDDLTSELSVPPEKMTLPDPLLNRHVKRKGAAELPLTSHLNWAPEQLAKSSQDFGRVF